MFPNTEIQLSKKVSIKFLPEGLCFLRSSESRRKGQILRVIDWVGVVQTVKITAFWPFDAEPAH